MIIATLKIKKPKVRRKWEIKPFTKIKESKKIYRRNTSWKKCC